MRTKNYKGVLEEAAPVAGPLKVSERLGTDSSSPWWGEHRSRYRYAAARVAGLKVLDVASGSGYGCRMLEEGGASAVRGCDISPDAIEAASAMFASRVVEFVQGDGVTLPFEDSEFDLVVSFETLEHVEDGELFIREIKRVVRPDGTLILSTPNEEITRNYTRNPYHLREYTPFELKSLLEASFQQVTVLGQTLEENFRVAPFLPGWDKPVKGGDRLLMGLWKVFLRLPARLRNFASRRALGVPFYPGETDYRFVPSHSRAPVLFAICEGPRK